MMIYSLAMAIFFALLALVGWGAGDIMVAKVSRILGNRAANFIWLIGSFLISSLYIPFAGPVNDWAMLFLAILINFFGLYGTIFYFRALEVGHTSLVGTISGAFPVVTVPLSILLFKESLTAIQIGAILLIISGLVLATFHFEEIKKRNLSRLLKEKSIVLSFATLLIWGIYWTLVRYPVEKIGWFWSSYPGYSFFIYMYLTGMVKRKDITINKLKNRRIILMIITMTLLILTANFAFNLGITYGFSSVVAPIAGSAPVIFVIISRFVFKERLTGQQRLGILFSLAGIVMMGIVSV
ncbi:hypothetical protein A2781_00805 [Candidatus Gottesmanbacteria bacterium RIFCSPHIGHO2_01_FULL_42_27]|uniref:EamA domain-containing protein n=2 Tax=Candidatus Gottesmaniibacteriota TaxID=1752720 RepID=A0A1F6BK85_9BACT|nr:MAG: hypothetical protein UV09_C0006G0022 [Candidatus Gottesmanbacteria bacterium GW2011_GWA2_42_18]OGG09700.1 MAG: hypothetical protein A2781_00805 [Candidatus Gottesmanbacteria bacterium RIFCSPHIGHO2_01_FULL_42_27]OGG22514.1 MAG: hypothetical protein A3E72_03645 [Candidatus Gottesmanbacteria bacterium RIFCSPHIGHO2_12_FULL_43_26]OGG34884.1 MAG: hypothetical protein A3G68_04395 [Candidatus Gottesmanbacteria bacterium RIFCSPLOWO2_12_FULL_42_10]OGG37182.1 MAG: hypothetical protein A2968_05105 